VGQLDSRDGALLPNELENAREHFDVLVFPNPKILRADAAFGQDGGRLGENERRAPDGAASEMDEVPVGSEPILARILAHRRDDDAVAELDLAEAEGRK
jgi:hypothetical protein